MASLARRNLLHDRVRLAVTLTGIVFAVVLSAIQLGLFVGFTRATSDVIRFAGADLWVTSRGVTHLELLRTLAHERGRAVVMVTHDHRATAYADRIVHIADGRLSEPVEEGHAQQLFIGRPSW